MEVCWLGVFAHRSSNTDSGRLYGGRSINEFAYKIATKLLGRRSFSRPVSRGGRLRCETAGIDTASPHAGQVDDSLDKSFVAHSCFRCGTREVISLGEGWVGIGFDEDQFPGRRKAQVQAGGAFDL